MAEREIPTGDLVTSTLSGALAVAGSSATIGTGLNIPATNGVLIIDYDSVIAIGVDNGPEVIFYTSYTTGTGALAGVTRGKRGTTDVAHDSGSKVAAAPSTVYLEEMKSMSGLPSAPKLVDRQKIAADNTVSDQLIQTGWSFVTGDGAAKRESVAITFNTAYADAEVIVIAGNLGALNGSNPVDIEDFVGFAGVAGDIDVVTHVYNIATTGFTAEVVQASANMTNGMRFGFAWTAIGTKAR